MFSIGAFSAGIIEWIERKTKPTLEPEKDVLEYPDLNEKLMGYIKGVEATIRELRQENRDLREKLKKYEPEPVVDNREDNLARKRYWDAEYARIDRIQRGVEPKEWFED